MSIALRITLLSWIVSLATVLICILITIPKQESFFLQNLKSKANGVAVSLHDVAAGAAINEDYASVVSAAQTMLSGDPDLEFLIIMKNEGFALILDQQGWKTEDISDAYWLPEKRESKSGIAVVPLFKHRVFHHAQPFDYSGIQWGWIHVGLSLKGYDQSIKTLYIQTLFLTLGCVVFSLIASLLFAKFMVRPILHLRSIMQRVAESDLSARADIKRSDELGDLAESVNIMTEALQHRDLIMESVRFAAQQFLRSARWEDVINQVLKKIGRAANISRAYLFENHIDTSGRIYTSQRYEWVEEGIIPQIENPELQNFYFSEAGFDRWITLLSNNEIIAEPVSEMIASERSVLESQEILSIIVIPVFVEGLWWGLLGFDDCIQDRLWTDAEKDSLRTGADMLGATIGRQFIQEALIEAKETLEQRVQERTSELRNQIIAKEQALADLSAAQASLVEMSRAAGMAEVATGVLHNVGNILNSINVSCTLLIDQLKQSRVGNLAKVSAMLIEPEGGIAYFLTEDPRGSQIPVYLNSLSSALQEEHKVIFTEAESLRGRIEHIKEIVSMQQNIARVSGVQENILPEQLLEDALKLNSGTLVRHDITVYRQYQPTPPITVERHKVLQILLNLINNAKYACDNSNDNKNITLRVFSHGQDRVCLQVSDNGMGIPSENLTRIFQHGFTTRKEGHGFGLHSGAIAAKELCGNLSVHSDGPGLGATFTLELPIRQGR
ncbi:MAG: HAMP domain-containing protein [Desulfobacterales bacterium]|nr:HAMP domain-containing protein [Desulfobacterales bacterium]